MKYGLARHRRDDNGLGRVRRYIVEHPLRWADDPEDPHAVAARGRARLLAGHVP